MQSLSTNTWSLIIFVFQILNLFAVLMLFAKTKVRMAVMAAITWVLCQILFIVYGYYTNQLGFVLLGICNILISIIASIMKVGEEETLNDDN